MNNKTVKKLNIMIKLRGDKVYDLYVDGEWISSRGNYDKILEDIGEFVKKIF